MIATSVRPSIPHSPVQSSRVNSKGHRLWRPADLVYAVRTFINPKRLEQMARAARAARLRGARWCAENLPMRIRRIDTHLFRREGAISHAWEARPAFEGKANGSVDWPPVVPRTRPTPSFSRPIHAARRLTLAIPGGDDSGPIVSV